MIDTVYVEQAAAEHPVARRILDRFQAARKIEVQHFGEVFNRSAQNFRLQKRRPALILAIKDHGHLLPAPDGYGVGGQRNYYFSHMFNCLYDCRYCFLQGMYRSANYVVFVNYEAFEQALSEQIRADAGLQSWFFSGYDCDSLALEPVTGFVARMLPLFERHPGVWLELRTKSTQVRSLLSREPLANVVVAFSFTPEPIARVLEHRVPAFHRRLEALRSVAAHGWPVGLRFDPLIYEQGFRDSYREMFQQLFAALDPDQVHSVSLGPFRLPADYFRTVQRLYPEEPLFAGCFEERNGVRSYHRDIEVEMRDFCRSELLSYLPAQKLFSCDF